MNESVHQKSDCWDKEAMGYQELSLRLVASREFWHRQFVVEEFILFHILMKRN
jgi:hypothetical protein